MGERLTHLSVEAFRGVPETWEIGWPGGKSMVVCGDNGTGKSTIRRWVGVVLPEAHQVPRQGRP